MSQEAFRLDSDIFISYHAFFLSPERFMVCVIKNLCFANCFLVIYFCYEPNIPLIRLDTFLIKKCGVTLKYVRSSSFLTFTFTTTKKKNHRSSSKKRRAKEKIEHLFANMSNLSMIYKTTSIIQQQQDQCHYK